MVNMGRQLLIQQKDVQVFISSDFIEQTSFTQLGYWKLKYYFIGQGSGFIEQERDATVS